MSTTNVTSSNITATVQSLDQLISLCKEYVDNSGSVYHERQLNFSEWIIQVATGIIKATNKEITSKFSVARIWSNDHSLIEMRTTLDAILTPQSSTPVPQSSVLQDVIESSVGVDKYRIDLTLKMNHNYVTEYTQLHHNGNTIIITPPIDKEEFYKMIELLKISSITHARDIVPLLNDVLNLTINKIKNLIPDNQLIDLEIPNVMFLRLWKGTDRMMVVACRGYQVIVGQLSNDCTKITPHWSHRGDFPVPDIEVERDEVRPRIIENFNEYVSDSKNYQRVAELIRSNVSNPEVLEIKVVPKYTVRVIDYADVGNYKNVTIYKLAYLNTLIVEPRIVDSLHSKIVHEIAIKNRSINDLVKSVENLLNS